MTKEEVKRLRTDAGLTQTQLAERMGLGVGGQVTVSRWESGALNISEPHARLLAILCSERN